MIDPMQLWTALGSCGARLTPGLSDAELTAVEQRFEFTFAPDHRELLSLALPLADDGRWPDWRHGDWDVLRKRVAWPVDGLLFDVEHDNLWLPGWGDRPADVRDAIAVASEELKSVPPLAPLYAHRYVPTVPAQPGNPVLSCYQADIIYYGRDLLDWFGREFGDDETPIIEPVRHVPFWTHFIYADG